MTMEKLKEANELAKQISRSREELTAFVICLKMRIMK